MTSLENISRFDDLHSRSSTEAPHQSFFEDTNSRRLTGSSRFLTGAGGIDCLERATQKRLETMTPFHDSFPVATAIHSNPVTALCARDGTVVASYSTGHVRVFDTLRK